jgi:hypothetical protein
MEDGGFPLPAMPSHPSALRVSLCVALLAVFAGAFCARAADAEIIPRGEVLLQAAPAPVLLAADAPPPPTVLQPPVYRANTTVTAPSPVVTPADYKALQALASEEVVIRITAVNPQAAKAGDDSIGPDAKAVAVRAVVLEVVRTQTNLKVGSVIYMLYGYAPPAPGKPGPPPVPIVQLNADYHAFLTGGSGETPYHPAAGAQSFLDPQAVVAEDAAPKYKSTGPLANPALLPTPSNPAPKGTNHITNIPANEDNAARNNLDAFVKLIQTGTQWSVSIAHADPLPLQTEGTEPPEPISFYSTPLGAPSTQPTVLLYRASVLPAAPPATGTLSAIRALVIGSDGHLLGDAPWARIFSDDSQPPLPRPTWVWSSYKVEITDPDTQKVQTIMLAGPEAANAPTPPAASPADAAAK